MTEREMLQNYADARLEAEQLSEQLKDAEAARNIAEATIIDALESKDATATAKYEGLGSLSLMKPKVRASVNEEYKEDLYEFLKDQNCDTIIRKYVHYTDLDKFVASLLEEGVSYPEFITYIWKKGVQFRRAK